MMSETEIVKRVAAVIERMADQLTTGDYSFDYELPSGALASEEIARAAIEALRETPECISKINGSANWPKMIDAILTPSPASK